MSKINNNYSEKQKRLLIVNQFFPPDFAATGQLIEDLALKLSDKDLFVKVFSGQPGYAFDTKDAPRDEKVGDLYVQRTRASQLVKGKAINGLLFCVRVMLHLVRHHRQQDLILLTTAPSFLPWVGYFSYLFFRLKYICLIYDLYPNVITVLGVLPENHIIVRMWHWLNRRTWLKANAIIVLSSSMKERIVEVCPEVKEKITVIHNWADGKVIIPRVKQDNWFAQENGLVDKFTILYSGNMGRCHDMKTIIDAAHSLQKYQDKFQFVFIGSGAQQEKIAEEADKLSLNNFSFLPYQKKEHLPYSLTACDISLISMAEGMAGVVAPSKLYSTLAAGNAVGVVCPQSSFLNHLIKDAGCGQSFANGDSQGLADFFWQLYQNPDLSAKMGKASRDYFLSHFTTEIAVNNYFRVITQVITQ